MGSRTVVIVGCILMCRRGRRGVLGRRLWGAMGRLGMVRSCFLFAASESVGWITRDADKMYKQVVARLSTTDRRHVRRHYRQITSQAVNAISNTKVSGVKDAKTGLNDRLQDETIFTEECRMKHLILQPYIHSRPPNPKSKPPKTIQSNPIRIPAIPSSESQMPLDRTGQDGAREMAPQWLTSPIRTYPNTN